MWESTQKQRPGLGVPSDLKSDVDTYHYTTAPIQFVPSYVAKPGCSFLEDNLFIYGHYQ